MRFIHRLLALLITLAQVFSPATGETFAQPVAALPTLRGVNLGGWLVLEPFLTSELFNGTNAIDQWGFDSQAGSEKALRQHWDTYCTEDDIKKLASYGINACVATFPHLTRQTATLIAFKGPHWYRLLGLR